MNTARIAAALAQVRKSFNTLMDVCEQELHAEPEYEERVRPQVGGPATRPVGGPGAPVRSSAAGPPAGRIVLPVPLTPARTPATLDDKVRLANLPDAIKIAKDVIRAVGADGVHLVDAVRGQLALQRIPNDEQLITEAIAHAKGDR